MQENLLQLFHQTREREISLRGQTVIMRLLTAYDILLLHAEKQEEASAFSVALRGNAALLKACLYRAGTPLFQSVEEVLRALSLEEINALVAVYRTWSREVDPSVCSDEKTIEALKKD